MMTRGRLIRTAGAFGALATTGNVALAQPGRNTATGARGEFIVRDAVVLTMDPGLGTLPRGDVHVRDGVIVAVGPDLTAPNAQPVPGHQMIAMPGLIDAHNHLWNSPLRNLVQEGPTYGYFPLVLKYGAFCSPVDVYRGVRLGVTELLSSGVTTVLDWAHNLRSPAYADADLAGLRDSGIRARFAYGYWQGGPAPDQTIDFTDVARLQRDWSMLSNGGLLSLGVALRTMPQGSLESVTRECAFARQLHLPLTIHSGGSNGQSGTIGLLNGAGLLGPDMQVINPTKWDEPSYQWIAASGAHVCISPFSEMRTSFRFNPLLDLLAHRIPVSLSMDTAAVTGNNDMFALMHVLIDTQFVRANAAGAVTPMQILELATMGGARDLGLADTIGSLTPGKRADLILIRTSDLNIAPLGDPATALVRSAQPYNVDTVIVDGRFMKRGGRIVAFNADTVIAEASETLARFRRTA
jgi:cytosine/adenosine deaminase-related metal-dependent hydrolase